MTTKRLQMIGMLIGLLLFTGVATIHAGPPSETVIMGMSPGPDTEVTSSRITVWGSNLSEVYSAKINGCSGVITAQSFSHVDINFNACTSYFNPANTASGGNWFNIQLSGFDGNASYSFGVVPVCDYGYASYSIHGTGGCPAVRRVGG